MFGDFVEEPGSFVHSVLANVNMLFLTFIRSASAERDGVHHPATTVDRIDWQNLVDGNPEDLVIKELP